MYKWIFPVYHLLKDIFILQRKQVLKEMSQGTIDIFDRILGQDHSDFVKQTSTHTRNMSNRKDVES